MPRLASSAIAFWACSSLVLVFAGCGSSGNADVSGTSSAPTPQLATASAEKPTVSLGALPDPDPDSLALVVGEQRIRLGELEQDALGVITKPKRALAFEQEPPVEGGNLKAKGWEGPKESLSLITTQGGRVVLALWTKEGVQESYVNGLVADHERVYGSTRDVVITENCHYWFWARGSSRLMICTSKGPKGTQGVAAAIGHYEVMDALRMSEGDAEKDASRAEQVLSQSAKAKK
ncbi:MAG: hypothetical protein JST40_06580 [Armatimonadetes bacterium]|nr:hypothetical protein [Armatimonadota bacterium]